VSALKLERGLMNLTGIYLLETPDKLNQRNLGVPEHAAESKNLTGRTVVMVFLEAANF
jgi:hypothetical protein